MCVLAVAWLALASAALVASAEGPRRPIPLIFDTDVGNDIDDVLALGIVHALESRGECELLAVTITKDDPQSAPFVDAVNTFYGRGEIPIGVVRRGQAWDPSRYTGLADQHDGSQPRYPHDLLRGDDAPEAVSLLRKTLAAAEDGTVVIVQVGTSTNLARLLASPPDAVSPLNGTQLVKRKVRLLSVMAGAFVPIDGQPYRETNVTGDIQSAQALADAWPTPIVYSGFEVGIAITFPAKSIERDFAYVPHHPLAEAYLLHSPLTHDRPSWDLTSVLYAVRPDQGYFDLSPRGRVRVAADGQTLFTPASDGPHQYLMATPEQRSRVQEALVQLASQPPAAVQNPK